MFKMTMTLMTILLAFSVVLVGCGTVPPKEALEKAYQASMDMNTASFEGTLELDFTPSTSLMDDPGTQMVVEFLKNAEFKVRGSQQQDPMQAEMILDVNLKGDVAMQLSIPIVVTEQKIWIKIPNIPMIPLPSEMAGKFVEIDFQQLSELSGGEIADNYNPFDMELQKQFVTELMGTVTKHFDEKTYFSDVQAEETAIPDSIQVQQIVKFEITNEQAKDVAILLVEQVVPDLLSIMADPKYEPIITNQAEMEQLKADYDTNKEQALQKIDSMGEMIRINALQMITAIDKNNYVPYSELSLDLDFTENGDTTTLGIKATGITTNINEEPVWEIGIPEGDEVLTIDQLQEMYFMGF